MPGVVYDIRKQSGHVAARCRSRGLSFAKFLIATYKGIKKGNPNAKVLIEGGPWNIDPNRGRQKWIEEYIQETRKIDPSVKFDGVGGHTYIDGPEQLDGNIREFLRMLDRNGCGRLGLFPISRRGEDVFIHLTSRRGHHTLCLQHGQLLVHWASFYDLGRAELSAAFSASGLAGGAQIPGSCQMHERLVFNRYMDIDFTGRAIDVRSQIPSGAFSATPRFIRM